MDISLDKKNDTEALIKITLKEADYQTQVAEKIKDYAKKANMKGFRPGKVPPGLIKRMYGTSLLVEEVNQILNESLTNYIKSSDLMLLGEPLPDEESMRSIDWESQKEFEFVYEVGFAKEFDYVLPEAGQIARYKIAVTEAEVDESIDKLREQHSTIENAEVSEAGDMVFVDMQQQDGTIIDSFVIEPDDVKEEVKDQLAGLKEGDKLSFKVLDLFPDLDTAEGKITEKSAEEVAALTDEYDFVVTQLSRRMPAELTEEFIKTAAGDDSVDTEAALRDKIEEQIASQYTRDTNMVLERDIIKALIEGTTVELPEAFLKKVMSKKEDVTEAQIDEHFEKSMEDVKWSLIRDKVVKEHEIKVEHEEVVSKVKEMMGGGNLPPEMAFQLDQFASNYLQQENGENYLRVHAQVLNSKLVDVVKEKVEFGEKTVTLDEFKAIAEAK